MSNLHNISQIVSAGVTLEDAKTIRRISMTLRRWYEHECNGAIQRDGERGDGLPFWHNTDTGRQICRAPDRERGALKRLEKIMASYPNLKTYIQGDPRGCSVYLLRPDDVPAGKDADAYYSRGIPVY
jgi:hypothetical protein